MNFTPEQDRALTGILRGQGHELLLATAGSGKSTFLAALAARLPGGVHARYLVFNRENARDAQGKFPSHVRASTFHTLGTGLLSVHFGEALVHDAQKLYRIYRGVSRQHPVRLESRTETAAVRYLVDLHRLLVALGHGEQETIDQRAVEQVRAAHRLSVPAADAQAYWRARRAHIDDPAESLRWVRYAHARSRQEAHAGVVDYQDLLTLPPRLGLGRGRYDLLLIDEAQDLNVPQQRLGLHVGHRLVLVADEFQAIYGFTGAAIGGVTAFADRLGCRRWPLSVSFRLPERHAELARTFSPALRARPGAPDGHVTDLNEADITEHLQPGDLIVCRSNAPLVPLAFRLALHGLPVALLGKDMTDMMVRSVLPELPAECQDEHFQFTTRKLGHAIRRTLINAGQQDTGPGAAARLSDLQDLLDTMRALAKASSGNGGLTSLTLVRQTGRELYVDKANSDRVTLCSVHRSKGSERDRVFILHPHLMPLVSGEPQEEQNIMFVAVTRAKDRLFFIHAEGQVVPDWTRARVPVSRKPAVSTTTQHFLDMIPESVRRQKTP